MSRHDHLSSSTECDASFDSVCSTNSNAWKRSALTMRRSATDMDKLKALQKYAILLGNVRDVNVPNISLRSIVENSDLPAHNYSFEAVLEENCGFCGNRLRVTLALIDLDCEDMVQEDTTSLLRLWNWKVAARDREEWRGRIGPKSHR
ncbi:hypothetical protein ANN_15403 [Periplaneta americana]|uniref:Uncharacterized protein n=1 Tax=Periplaneta americana TaxID=6978 RepID=A0ABQ8SHH6_PERAM|nr:hypothetical protein ANN_15403 [Periplaneta americana]